MADSRQAQDLVRDLIAIPSVNPSLCRDGGGENEIAHFIADWLSGAGLEPKVVEAAPGRPNVICTLGPPDAPTLILNGHTDTVGVEGMASPFEPRVDNGRVYGRGACDMKGGLAAMMLAMSRLRETGSACRVVFAAVCDEEYASVGTECLVRDYASSAHGALVLEPTGLQVHTAHKGFAWVQVTTAGRAAHGSRPLEGIDAIAHMGRVLSDLEDLGIRLMSKRHHILGPPSLHASTISGGVELSTYPPSCVLEYERRLIPGETRELVAREIDSIISTLKTEDSSFHADCSLIFHRPPLETDPEDDIVKAVAHAVAAVTGRPAVFGGSTGWLDSSILDSAGIPSVIVGTGGGGMHAGEEWVDIGDITATADIILETTRRFASLKRIHPLEDDGT